MRLMLESALIRSIRVIRVPLLLLFALPLGLAAQDRDTDLGASFSFEVQKELSRKFTLSFEEEIRLVTNDTGFDRNALTAGLTYFFLDKRMKLGAAYCYLYMYNDKHYYEHRHRYYATLSYKQPLGSFDLSWRGRFQGTYRDENRGEYRVNPKYILRNRLELEYTIFGSPWKPFISAEGACTTNDPRGNEFYRIRYLAGVNWRLNRTDYVGFNLRFDQYFQTSDDPNLIGIGISYWIKL